MTRDEMQKAHERALTTALASMAGQGRDSDWALVRALVHKAIHVAADRKAGEFCAVATLLAEMLQHAHGVMHPEGELSYTLAMTDDNRSVFQKMKDELKAAADEVRLKVHLGGMEAKELWEKLEPKVAKFQQDAEKASVSTGDAITEGVTQLGTDLKAQVEKLREKLNKKD